MTTALITGASSGIGLELSQVFARTGHDVILVARSEDKLQALKNELSNKYDIEATVFCHDLTDTKAPQTLFDQIQQSGQTVDVLVNNAGYGDYSEFAQSDWAKLEGMILLNVLALTHLSRLFLPGMIQRGHGKVLNLASTAAFQPGPMMAVYFATKAYVLSFSEAIAAETSEQGINVSVICPGPTQSDFIDRANMGEMAYASESVRDNLPTSAEVAQFSYNALQKGQLVAVHGIANKVMALSTRFAPRSLVLRGVKRFMAPA